MTYAKEGGHWYKANGDPCYTQIVASGKNKGNDRPTTLRDARKLDLYPSVTTVMGIMDKPALNMWKVDQAIMAALTCPRLDDETEKEWIYRVKHQDATETARLAAEEGTRIHGALENYFLGNGTEKRNYDLIASVDKAMYDAGVVGSWTPEKSCVDVVHGFAGKVDLYCEDWVIDFKTKDGDLSGVRCYEDQFRQLAAYREALNLYGAKCANVFISRDPVPFGQPAVKVVIHTEAQTEKGWNEFHAILNCWQAIKGYKPQ
ncbi:hypothetical protein KAR91_46475 [Candidatus Pacearchaeota archaeon]|nr:hypothetical protein [Candidatus Pacearchaeota archaeon]